MDQALPAVVPAAVHDFSLLGLFLQADPVVKGVMLLLALASVGCWAVVLDKAVRLGRKRRDAAAFEARVRAGAALRGDAAAGVPGAILAAAEREWRDHDAGESRAERRERIERAMRAAMATELRRVEPGLPFLATVGSAAPFVGLFGTVWGIMNSFQSIAQSQDTSLAVVAPGIAEALFATAIGLVAAIPAVIAYNKLATELGRLAQRLAAAIGELGGELSRRPAGAQPGAHLREAAE
jgi:TolQ protein